MELTLSLCLGIGLAAACGFRVFVPLLGIGIAAMAGHVELADGLSWVGSWPAVACFTTATILEIVAYYVPWLDNLLDSLATPAAVVAGAIAMASVISEMSPLMRWTLAVIAGGGTAGFIQSVSVGLRGASTATTAGTANWMLATTELIASLATTGVSLLAPLLAAVLVAVLLVTAGIICLRLRSRKSRANHSA